MTFEYDEFADVMWVSLSKPESPCVYAESQTHGVLLRIEESTGAIRGFQVTAWNRRVAHGPVLVSEIGDTSFADAWKRAMPADVA